MSKSTSQIANRKAASPLVYLQLGELVPKQQNLVTRHDSEVRHTRSHVSCSSEDRQGCRIHVICTQPYNAKSHLDLHGGLPTWDLRLHCLMTVNCLASSSSTGHNIRYVGAPASQGHPQC